MPVISVVVPLYNTPAKFLREMVDSVVGQSYPNWQLVLADASDKEYQQQNQNTYRKGTVVFAISLWRKTKELQTIPMPHWSVPQGVYSIV